MAPASVPAVKAMIRSVSLEQAQRLAEMALSVETAEEVLELCRNLTAKVAPEILELVK